jgi:Phage Terminase
MPRIPKPVRGAEPGRTQEESTVSRKANVAVAQDPAGNLKPAKDKSTERIDGIVALIMAIGRALVAQEEPQPFFV